MAEVLSDRATLFNTGLEEFGFVTELSCVMFMPFQNTDGFQGIKVKCVSIIFMYNVFLKCLAQHRTVFCTYK